MMRKAVLEDIPAIRAMAEVVFRDTYKEILSPEQMEYMMDMMYSEESLLRQMTEDGHIFFICEDLGYVSYHFQERLPEGVDVYHLEKIYVMPSEQGSGLGRELFEMVVSEVRSQASGPARIELNVNRNNKAVTFYQHLGMHVARQGDFPIGNGFYMNDYIMSLEVV